MKREAFKMFLKSGYEKEYERRHAAIWPELKKMLSDGGVYDYSIYWDKETNILFACQKTKGEESSQDMGANPIVQKWWEANPVTTGSPCRPITPEPSARIRMVSCG